MDRYTYKARIAPVFIVALPAFLAALAWNSGDLASWKTLLSVFMASGGAGLLAQISRHAGKSKEPALFLSWGGVPTTRRLRHGTTGNAVIAEQRRAQFQALCPSITLPTAEEERASPDRADQRYEACVRWLIEKTRDKKRFGLVFQELCNYGFSRNLWGLKPVGAVISVAAIAAIAGRLMLVAETTGIAAPPGSLVPIGCGSGCLLLLLVWIFCVTPRWVRTAAEAYADRLLAALDSLEEARVPA